MSALASVVQLDAHRRHTKLAHIVQFPKHEAIASDLHIAVTTDGTVLFDGAQVKPHHALAVLTICMAVANDLMALHCREAL